MVVSDIGLRKTHRAEENPVLLSFGAHSAVQLLCETPNRVGCPRGCSFHSNSLMKPVLVFAGTPSIASKLSCYNLTKILKFDTGRGFLDSATGLFW